MASGSPRKLQLDGTPFDMAADIDLTQGVGQELEGIATTGDVMPKITKKAQMYTGVSLVVDDDDWELLQELAERKDFFPSSYTNVNGSSYTGEAMINIPDGRTSSENKVDIEILAKSAFEAFVA